MLTADATTQVGTHLAALADGVLDERADTVLVEHLEGIDLQDLLVEIDGQERGDVVAAVAEGHLREVVGTE